MKSSSSLKRRHFLTGSLAAPWLAGCGEPKPMAREVWVSAQGAEDASFGAAWVEPNGASGQVQTGFRGHDVVPHPLRAERVLLIARRPGTELAEFDLIEQRIVTRTTCEDNFEMGGHGAFSPDGQVLFTAECNYQEGEGYIVVRDGSDYGILDRFPSRGVGPHELAMMPDQKTLVVANGGLLTHPDTGREVLNLDTMRSRLTFLDSHSGELLDEYAVSESKASIRHLDVSEQGEVSVALQMQRDAVDHEELAPLAAVYHPDRGLSVIEGPESLLFYCNDYMGSTRINNKTRIAGFTSPRGDIALFWDLDSHELAGYHRFHDVCGLTVSLDQERFVLSNSAGQIRCLDARTLEECASELELDGIQWDNHMRAIALPV